MDAWTGYILNCSDKTRYTGCTNNLDERLIRHKRGEVLSTKARLPVSIVVAVVLYDKYRTFEFEKYLKLGSGNAFSTRRFHYNLAVASKRPVV
jgi:putative endonuclease